MVVGSAMCSREHNRTIEMYAATTWAQWFCLPFSYALHYICARISMLPFSLRVSFGASCLANQLSANFTWNSISKYFWYYGMATPKPSDCDWNANDMKCLRPQPKITSLVFAERYQQINKCNADFRTMERIIWFFCVVNSMRWMVQIHSIQFVLKVLQMIYYHLNVCDKSVIESKLKFMRTKKRVFTIKPNEGKESATLLRCQNNSIIFFIIVIQNYKVYKIFKRRILSILIIGHPFLGSLIHFSFGNCFVRCPLNCKKKTLP